MHRLLGRVFASLVAFLAAAAPDAWAQTKPSDSTDATRVPMARIPTQYDVSRAFPAGAREQGVPGRADLSCVVRPSGSLTNCSVLSEAPSGWGFGEAALNLSLSFRVAGGFPGRRIEAGSRVTVPVRMYSRYWYALDPPSEPGTAPRWSVRTPMPTDLIVYRDRYPRNAGLDGLAGWVLLSCLPTSGGWMSDCKVQEEDPAGMGFAKAGIALMHDGAYHMEPSAARHAISEGKRVLVPLTFNPGIPAS